MSLAMAVGGEIRLQTAWCFSSTAAALNIPAAGDSNGYDVVKAVAGVVGAKNCQQPNRDRQSPLHPFVW